MEQASRSPRTFLNSTNKNASLGDCRYDLSAKRGTKRSNDDEITFDNKRTFKGSEGPSYGGKKFSANDRLHSYRKALETKQNQVVKVHTLQNLNESDVTSCARDNNLSEGGFAPAEKVAVEDKGPKSVNSRLKKYKESAFLEASQKCTDNIIIEDTEMDWSPISEEQLQNDIHELRQHYTEILSRKSSLEEYLASEIPTNTYIFKDTFIVVDTNVFLSHLHVVKYLMNIKLNGVYRPFVLIPWVVIQELDYMKDGRDCRPALQISARKVISFINECLLHENSHLKGQSVIDASKHCIQSKQPDDGILACCLQVFERGNRAILLSNDKNLRNKAMINAVPAYSTNEIFRELEICSPSKEARESQRIASKVEGIENHLTTLLNTIIHAELLSAYGEPYYKMGICKDAPWNLEQCLLKFEKLWFEVFSEKLQKQFLQNVQELRKLLSSSRGMRNANYLQKFVEISLNICLYLKNSSTSYRELVADCIDKIVQLK